MRQLDPTLFTRLAARHQVDRRAWLAILLFMTGHPEQSWPNAARLFILGEGPAAIAMGRAKARQ